MEDGRWKMEDRKMAARLRQIHSPSSILHGNMNVGLEHYLTVSFLLFALGLLGVIMRRNLLVIYMSLELMLNAANLALVSFSRFNNNLDGQVLVFFIITVAAAEVAVGLALIVALYRKRQSAHVEDLTAHETVNGFAEMTIGIHIAVWLILFLPLLSAAVITLFTLNHRNVSALLSIGAVVAGFVLTHRFHQRQRLSRQRRRLPSTGCPSAA